MQGMESKSTATNSIPIVDSPASANGVKSDAMSKVSNNSAASNYGPGSSDTGSSISSISREIDNKREESKAFWRKYLKK